MDAFKIDECDIVFGGHRIITSPDLVGHVLVPTVCGDAYYPVEIRWFNESPVSSTSKFVWLSLLSLGKFRRHYPPEIALNCGLRVEEVIIALEELNEAGWPSTDWARWWDLPYAEGGEFDE